MPVIGIEGLFFELIRVSIGNQVGLSRAPEESVWINLFELAKKQSLVGVCFVGLQRLQMPQKPPVKLYLEWMAMAAKIQQRNETLNKQCAELQAKLSVNGFRSCILKGQGVAQLYAAPLRALRQSGDIDIWIEGGYQKVLGYAKTQSSVTEIHAHHVDLNVFKYTEVEAHFTIGDLHNKWRNRRFQIWQKSVADLQFEHCCDTLNIKHPTTEFNLVFLMAHCHRHLFSDGLGLRQMMDYFFALMNSKNNKDYDCSRIRDLLNDFGLLRFAKAVMWIMQEVFGLGRDLMICEPDERLGRFVLKDILRGGNFGSHDSTYRMTEGASHTRRFGQKIVASLRYVRYFPQESFWSIVDYVCMYFKHIKTNKDLSNKRNNYNEILSRSSSFRG